MATKVSVNDRIEPTQFSTVADKIIDDQRSRKKKRGDLEKQWKEIDRQLAMDPELSHKQSQDGTIDPGRAWLPETELPLQAQTLEILLSDCRRMLFPKGRNWFKARAALTDKYLEAFDKAKSIFPGERGTGSRVAVNQDGPDRLVEAMVAHWHSQYDFRANIDIINAEALTYSAGVGRLRPLRRKIMGLDANPRGDREQIIPVYVPRSIKNVYLDDSQHALMHEGVQLGPNIIQRRQVNLVDLKAAAQEGGDDPKDPDGGYIAEEINRLTSDKQGNVELLEMEGDLVIETSQSTDILRNVVVTAAVGAKRGSKQVTGLVRYQEGPGFCSYNVHRYHVESTATSYGTSPLLKGMPMQLLASQAMNRTMESAQLKIGAPTSYDKDDTFFASTGGPVIEPYALWETIGEITAHTEVGGDPATMFALFKGLVDLYADVTGVNPPRLGAQTKSHTTAFAKDVELQQGAVRTVDFVNSLLAGPLTRLLELEYRMGLKHMTGMDPVYVEPWNEFVQIERRHMPEIVKFLAIGAGAPAEDEVRAQQRLSSAQFALQLDAISQQQGNPPSVDVQAMIREALSSGGWTDPDAVILEQQAPEGGEVAQSAPGLLSEEQLGSA